MHFKDWRMWIEAKNTEIFKINSDDQYNDQKIFEIKRSKNMWNIATTKYLKNNGQKIFEIQ